MNINPTKNRLLSPYAPPPIPQEQINELVEACQRLATPNNDFVMCEMLWQFKKVICEHCNFANYVQNYGFTIQGEDIHARIDYKTGVRIRFKLPILKDEMELQHLAEQLAAGRDSHETATPDSDVLSKYTDIVKE